MKIALIQNAYEPYGRGGASSIVKLLADNLERQGHKIIIIATKPHGAFLAEQGIYRVSSCFYSLVKLPVVLRLFWHFWDGVDFVSATKTYRWLKKEKPDLIITHNLKGLSLLTPFFLKFLHVKTIYVLHDIQLLHPSGLLILGREKSLNSFLARIYQTWNRFIFRSVKNIVSPSQWLLNLHRAHGFFEDTKATVIPNPGAEISQQSTINYSGADFNFLFVGQMEKHKGILLLLRAFQKLPSVIDNKKVFLQIAGVGEALPEALKLAQGSDNIKFLGWDSNQEINWMTSSQALIVPSLCYENSPLVIYKAFGCGLPVLGADLGGINELLAGDRGVLFDPRSEQELVDKMRSLVIDTQILATRAKQAKFFVCNLDINNYIEKILTL